jgi:hypothetical protein
MIVVDPDQVPGPVHLCDALRISLISLYIGVPLVIDYRKLRCDILPEKVVEEGPEGFLAIAFVVIVGNGVVYPYACVDFRFDVRGIRVFLAVLVQ